MVNALRAIPSRAASGNTSIPVKERKGPINLA
jgi:hypothetical protein